ncbi:MAG: autotransporter outer membrane beta-barrel domain-containing protein, partial [Myxococcota bacterium]
VNDQVQARIRDMWWHAAAPYWNSGESSASSAGGSAPVQAEGDSGFGSWLDGYGVWGDLEGNSNYADLDYDIGGLTLGADYRFGENWLVGGAGGWARSHHGLDGRAASGESDNYHSVLYLGYATPLFHAGVSGRGALVEMETERPVDYPMFSETARGDFDGVGWGARIETGINALHWFDIDFQPFVGFDYAHLQHDAFDEQGSAYSMRVSSNEVDSELLELGLRLRSRVELGDQTWMYPELGLAWLYEFGDLDRRVQSYLLGDDARTPINVQSAEPVRGSLVGTLRWAVSIANRLHAFAGYTIQVDKALVEQQVTAGLRLRW